MDAGPARIAVQSARRERHLDVLRGGQRWDEVELLEDEPDRLQPELRQLAVAEPSELAPLEFELALGGAVEGAEELEQRRLSGPAGADDHEELAAGDLEVDVAHGVHLLAVLSVAPADAAEGVDRLAVEVGDGHFRSPYSMVLRASAGRSRAARRPPTAPARTPPAIASATAARIRPGLSGAPSLTRVEPVVSTAPWPKGPKPRPAELEAEATVALRSMPMASITKAPVTPRSTPIAPPSMPCRRDSP